MTIILPNPSGGDVIKPGIETEMERNETESACARQLISEHFDFTLSQLNRQGRKSSESDNLEPELSY